MSDATHGLYHDTCHHRIYGLSCAAFDELHAYAEGSCQLCRLPEHLAARGRLVIDHLSSYGAHLVRGLLCDRCNAFMRRVDALEVKTPPTCVYDYRSNSWFARQLDPRGADVRYLSPGLPGEAYGVPWAYVKEAASPTAE